MRKFTDIAPEGSPARGFLAALADKGATVAGYRAAMTGLGRELGDVLMERMPAQPIALAASSEDADWLVRGVLESLGTVDARLAVLWSIRSNPYGDEHRAMATIVKTHMEDVAACKTLVVCKSIIFTSCIVRSNLSAMIERMAPESIFIVAPVLFKGAQERLAKEFPDEISDRFQFIYLAEDDEDGPGGVVIPGIGGSVYERLGIGDSQTKNGYVPELVKERRKLQPI